MAFGKVNFALGAMQSDGCTFREHLVTGYRKSKGLTLEQHFMKQLELEGDYPTLSPFASHIWAWFCDLSSDRGNNGYGQNSLTATGIMAWCALTRTRLEQWELRAIRVLDREYMTHANKKVTP